MSEATPFRRKRSRRRSGVMCLLRGEEVAGTFFKLVIPLASDAMHQDQGSLIYLIKFFPPSEEGKLILRVGTATCMAGPY